ncbi:hypothetical protein PRK78_001820 [Emydomyces testavorans]|uniref:F-box domain-containing protein n=1 Tax=Emydomyces testavorans TaxID=2070801 RepID=A0AAF0DF83_9EURO|nr:hypothetical protein PRK78_001820 [Emydomyces testavorans]
MVSTRRQLVPPADQRPTGRPVRSTRQAVRTYQKSSGSDPSVSGNSDAEEEGERRNSRLCRVPERTRGARMRNPQSRRQGPSGTICLGIAKRALESETSTVSAKRAKLDTDQTKPPWTTLPYHVLFDIFLYLSPYMRENPLADTSQSIKCLLRLSRLCRAFFEPAISALYFSPPIFPTGKLKGLLDLLKMEQNSLYINYRDKVKHLEADVYRTKPMMIYSLLKLTPRLRYLRLYDLGEYTRTLLTIRHFPRWLFCDMPQPDVMRNLRLHSWEWNGEIEFPSIKSVHSHPAFTSLKSVRFFKLRRYNSARRVQSSENPDSQDLAIQAKELASALSLLPNLERLEFKECGFVGDLLPLLPMDLDAVSIINCCSVDSSAIEKFLSNHGQHLYELILTQNSRLSMVFTTRLSELCPRLRVFIMHLNPLEGHSMHTVRPYFEELLLNHESPSWPSTLQWLELQRLRMQEISTAETFFNSIIDVAPYLRDLRTLIITAIISSDWRDRAKFREHWMEKLEWTFLRRAPTPRETRATSSLPVLTQTKHASSNLNASGSKTLRKREQTTETAPMRRSNRIAQKTALAANGENESIAEKRREHSTEISEDDSSARPTQDQLVQGMCDVVKIRVDNLRPASFLVSAEDLTDEDSDDSDWNGVDPVFDESYAW